jgi:WD40 repeat protein/serine/threonine protein kinase
MALEMLDLHDIFNKAIETNSDEERGRYLDEACRNDPQSRARVEALLRAHSQAGGFFGGKSPAPAPTEFHRISELPGTLIGPYKLLEQIGEGGFGVVFMAEQTEPVRRKVALKVLKEGMDTRQVIARFETERQALAIMDHPNIARVFDGGATATGRPYFVMELVRGVSITEYCDQNHLTPCERLELFATVCHAVHHAHQKELIHRDLKPSNVLVSRHDTTPIAKIIDFGVAKALGQSLTDKTLFTGMAQMIGTPMYMSPEQAGMSDLDVDTRSDIYSLGVLLYELLTGTTPFDKERLKSVGFDEMRRIIREDEPPRPSTRISTERAAGDSTDVGIRGSDPRQLSRLLRGELDWIVMKALEKDRSRRYESASALAADIQRYLSDEPVLACPPTPMYRFHKFARKYKAALFTATAIALCLMLGMTVSAWQAIRATAAEEQAAVNEAQAKANAQKAAEKANEATTQRDEAQKQRDEVRGLNDKLRAAQDELRQTLYAAHMSLAQRAWEEDTTERTLLLLGKHRPKATEPDLRGFEWHYLNRLCHSELLTIQQKASVNSAAFHPNGNKVATGLADGTAKIWDAQTGKFLSSLDGHHGSIRCLAYSGDGQKIVTCATGKYDVGLRAVRSEVKLWNAQSGELVLTLEVPDFANCVAISLDGKQIAAACGPLVKVWNAESGKERFSFSGHKAFVRSLAFSPDGKTLASGGAADGTDPNEDAPGAMKAWSTETGTQITSLVFPGRDINAVVFSPDGERLATISFVDSVRIFETQNFREQLAIRTRGGRLFCAAFSPDGKQIAIGSSGRIIKVFDAQTGQQTISRKGHVGEVWSVAFSPDGKRLASASADNTVRIWNAVGDQDFLSIRGHSPGADSASFSPDGKLLVSTGHDGTVKLWDSFTGEELFTLKGHTANVRGPTFSPDGKRLATASFDGTVRVWDLEKRQTSLTFGEHAAPVRDVEFSPDGKKLLSASSNGKILLWDANTGEILLSLKAVGPNIQTIAFSPSGESFASGSSAIQIWSADTGEQRLIIHPGGGILGLSFSPDGKQIAGGVVTQGIAKVWDVTTGQELLSLKQYGWSITAVAFSPDGTRLATASASGAAKLCDAHTGEQLLAWNGPFGGIAFSRDGNRLVMSGGGRPNGQISIVDARPLPEKP